MTDRPRQRRPEESHTGGDAMTRVYVGALLLEAAIIAALWAFGRMYS